jgi:periplasmic protein TonB
LVSENEIKGQMWSFFKNRMNLDEITFEKRNKEYGAYFLRKKYNFNILISLVIGSFIFSSFVIYPFLRTITSKHEVAPQREIHIIEVKMDKMEPPKDIYIPPAPPPAPPQAQANIKYIAPVVVDSVPPIQKAMPTVADVLASTPSKDTTLIASRGGSGDDQLIGQKGEDSDEPFMLVEVPPTFKGGGLEEFRNWVQKRTVYPVAAQDNGIQGKVYLSFIVERDGSVSHVTIVKGVDKLLDDEAIKAIMASPKWTPGLQRGRPVRVRFTINLVFAFTK